MIEFLQELKTVGLTALFNPTFLFLLVVLFFLGKLVGWMTRNINVWKFLAVAYFGIFVFRPLQDAGLVIGGIFILGVASMYMDFFRSIFGWAGGVGDVVSAFGSRKAFEDIRRLEREIEDLKSQLRSSQASGSSTDGSAQQAAWRAQSKTRKTKSKSNSSSGGRDSAGSTHSDRSSRNGDRSKPRGNPRTSRKGYQKRRQSAGGASSKQRSQTSSGSNSRQQKSSKQSCSGPNTKGANAINSSGAQQKTKQNSSKSQSSQQSTGSQYQSGSQSQSGGVESTTSATMSAALRDRYLLVLELVPGQSYTQPELKAAWRKMAFKTHPDRGGSTTAFADCLAAYKALT